MKSIWINELRVMRFFYSVALTLNQYFTQMHALLSYSSSRFAYRSVTSNTFECVVVGFAQCEFPFAKEVDCVGKHRHSLNEIICQ